MAFFTLLLGTKNRPELLRETMQSVVLQDFNDYELIVSDNWNDERTKQVIDSFPDPRIKYIRPDREFNIPDHWDWLIRQATGEYVFMLTDRSLLCAGALRRIAAVIREYAPQGVEAYSWNHEIYDGQSGYMRPVAYSSKEVVVCDSNELLLQYAKKGLIDPRFPQLPNACFDRRLGERIRAQHDRMVFPTAPDLTANCLMLLYTAKVAHIKERSDKHTKEDRRRCRGADLRD